MTEYGRGTGPEPWHPDDPLYGDPGWTGQHAQTGHHQATGGAPQHYPQQQPFQPQDQYAQQDQYQQQGQYDQQHQQYAQHPGYAQQPHPQQPQQPYPGQHQGHQTYAGQSQQQPMGGAQYQGGGTGSWDTGSWTGGAPDPYGAQQPGGYPDGAPDLYPTAEAYPPPQPPNRRHVVPEPAGEWQEAPEEPAAEDDAAVRTEEPEHAFFAGGGDDEDEDGDDGGGRGGRGRRNGGRKPKKGRNGMACLIVAVVLVGGVGGIGYYGYDFLKAKFGAPEDYAGEGSGSVEVEIKPGSGLLAIGQVLKEAGVVKSAEAFASAAQDSKKAVQPGQYTLHKEMSAASAVTMMVSGDAQKLVMVNPGDRNAKIYKLIDTRLKLSPGTTAAIAKKEAKNLGLPAWALNAKDVKDPLEGFLYPQRYDVAKSDTADKLLKKMVANAVANYQGLGFDEAKAKSLGLKSPLDLITVASLVQAEGNNKPDYDKIARVVYNRLKPNNTETYGLLDFDSTVNYIRNSSTLNVGSVDDLRKVHDPYNTYWVHGLPAGPIGNPGEEALHSAVNPASGPWYYFVSLKDKTLFAATNEEQNRNRAKYQQQNSGG
ncbi:endolytic transglycosylase MltG [Streptomyces sp. NPDC093225]|uniref:endolytic transglycosylase MltG n=1 Tax=Streptomyces sp. NPDC093225 TaxID=3366034 RepID=UPI003808EDA4